MISQIKITRARNLLPVIGQARFFMHFFLFLPNIFLAAVKAKPAILIQKLLPQKITEECSKLRQKITLFCKILDQNFYVGPKFLCWTKIFILEQNYFFGPEIWILKFFHQNFEFKRKF